MKWTKISTNLIVERIPDKDLLAIVKYQLLWATLEHQPDDATALRYMSANQLATARQYVGNIAATISQDIKVCADHRKSQKAYSAKNLGVEQKNDNQCDNQCDNHTDDTDKIRIDKNRIDKTRIEKKDKEKTIITANNAYWVLQNMTPEEILVAIKEQIVPNLGAYFYNGDVSDEKLKNYIVKRQGTGWQTKHGLFIRDLGCDLANWLKNEKTTGTPPADEKDVADFVKNWNEFVKGAKGSDYWAKCETADENVKEFIPAAKVALLKLMAQEARPGKPRFITPKKSTDDIWAWAIDVFRQRRFYSDFLYHECNITPKFFCTHIAELADPYCDEYLNDSEKHTHA